MSAVVAALVHVLIGSPWHVACGALAGIAAAYLAASPQEDRGGHAGGGAMTVDGAVLTAILAMAVVNYRTRIAGLFVSTRMFQSGRAKAAFDAIPPAVLVAVIAPTALTTGWAEDDRRSDHGLRCNAFAVLGTIVVGVVSVVRCARSSSRSGALPPRAMRDPSRRGPPRACRALPRGSGRARQFPAPS